MNVEFNGSLLPIEYKKIENQIIQFFVEIGKQVSLNPKTSEIFGYFKIYDHLTQEQLKLLTNFSSSTISTTLQLLLNIGTVSKEVQLNSRKKLYSLRNNDLIYTSFTLIIETLDNIDSYVNSLQEEAKTFQSTYPDQVEFFIRCLNHVRNYVEVQRRAINKKSKHSFFEEDVTEILHPKILIEYPPEIKKIELKFVKLIENGGLYVTNEPILNRIVAFLISRQRLTQNKLIELTGFSRSTISRYLKKLKQSKFVKKQPKQYQKSLVYYVDSAALSIIADIVQTDYFIFSWIPKFKTILDELRTDSKYKKNNDITEFLAGRITLILDQIEDLRASSNLLEQARDDLIAFFK